MNKEGALKVQHLQAQIDRLTLEDRTEQQRKVWENILEAMNHRRRDKMLDRIAKAKAAGKRCVMESDVRRKTEFE